jgi:hypothetical protein
MLAQRGVFSMFLKCVVQFYTRLSGRSDLLRVFLTRAGEMTISYCTMVK